MMIFNAQERAAMNVETLRLALLRLFSASPPVRALASMQLLAMAQASDPAESALVPFYTQLAAAIESDFKADVLEHSTTKGTGGGSDKLPN